MSRNELHEAIKDSLRTQLEQNYRNVGRARNTITLASNSVEMYPEGSPWRIAETAILDASKRCLEADMENIRVLEKAVADIEALDR